MPTFLTDSVSSARKTAKNVLKAYPSSLRLYNAYALIEWRLGNKSAAENVFSTALSMCSGLEPGERIDDLLLWRCWAWELLPDAPERALRKILSIPEGLVAGRGAASSADTSYSSLAAPPIELLKTKKVKPPCSQPVGHAKRTSSCNSTSSRPSHQEAQVESCISWTFSVSSSTCRKTAISKARSFRTRKPQKL